MPRRVNGKRFLGNTNTMEVHDLDTEQPQCQIDEIITHNHAVFFDYLEDAKAQGYDPGHFCLDGSTR